MSVFSAMNTAVAGLGAQSKAMGHISDNIANSRTIGYKRTDTNFRDLVTTSSVLFHAPGAVTATPTFVNSVQGDLLQSDVGTNIAISGQGFFVVSKADRFSNTGVTFGSEPFFTRRGDFTVDRSGYLINGAGYYLQGKPVINQDTFATSDTRTEVNVSAVTLPPERTTRINYNANLPSTPPAVDPNKFVTTDTNGRSQQDTLTLFGTFEPGDIYTVQIGPTSVSYTVTGAEGSLPGVRNALVAAINAAVPAATAVASSYGIDQIKLDSGTVGTPFTTSVSTTNVTPVAKVDQVTVGGTPDIGDTYNIQITDQNGTLVDTVSYLVPATPVPTTGTIRDGILNKMQTNPNITNRLIVTSGPGAADITLTSIVPGLTFTTTPSVINGGTAAVGTLTVTNVTANVLSTADNFIAKDTTKTNVAIGSPAPAPLPILASLPINAPINVGTPIANGSSVSISSEDFNANTLSGGVVTIYDQVGTPMDVQLRWMNRGADKWQLYYYDPQYQPQNNQPHWVPLLGANGVQFNLGQLTTPTVYQNLTFTQGGRSITVDNMSFAGPNGTDPGMTQYSDTDISVHKLEQNGSRTGNMTSVTIDDKGYVTALFDNGLSRKLYQVPIAMFYNGNALARHDGAAFSMTEQSGTPRYEVMGRNGAGTINASSVENSNVDIADQFTKMIVAQRVYSANARTITTSDEMLQEIIGLKR